MAQYRGFERNPRLKVPLKNVPRPTPLNPFVTLAVRYQYFRTVISDEQREEFGHLVQDSIQRIEAAEFLPHSGIRFPQNPCTSCAYIGLCLGRPDLTKAALVRRPGAEDFGLFDELNY